MLNLDGGQEVGVQRFRAAAIQFSRDPAPPGGSFEEKRPIINEEEPPMDTKEHKFLLNYLWKSFPPSRPLADPSRASSNPLVALRRPSCPLVDIFFVSSWIPFVDIFFPFLPFLVALHGLLSSLFQSLGVPLPINLFAFSCPLADPS